MVHLYRESADHTVLNRPMEKTEKKIGIIGIGNLICGDEGFGIHVINYLEERYIFPENILLQDAGTAGIYLAPVLEECDPVIVIDVVDIEAEPGSMHYYDLEDIRLGNIQTRMSPHQLGFLEILQICRLRGTAPGHVFFYCAVPEDLETSIELSDVLAPRVAEVAVKIIGRLADLGIELTMKIQEGSGTDA